MKKIKALLSGSRILKGSTLEVSIKDVDCSIAYHGLEELDAEIDIIPSWMSFNKEELDQYDVCVGGVNDCRWALNTMWRSDYDLDCYPEDLRVYLNREVETSTVREIVPRFGSPDNTIHKFIKPVRPKAFTAFLTSNEDDWWALYNVRIGEPVYITDVVSFSSEWRVYVKDKQIVRVCNYSGNPTIFPNMTVVREMIRVYPGPCCYALDVGIIGVSTALVEVNDFYSIGNYGLFPREYVEMLLMRWKQLKDPSFKL